jgi:hypothetical protein
MRKKLHKALLFVLLFAAGMHGLKAQGYWIGFYNLENLFDTIQHKEVNNNQYTPNGSYNWTSRRFHHKIDQLNRVIDSIGHAAKPNIWGVLGVCEVENTTVLKALCDQFSAEDSCHFVHFESPDLRGIDVGLLYNANAFKPTHFERVAVRLFLSHDMPKYTRDLLVVSGWLGSAKVHFIVAHWPSRSGGQKRSEHFRMTASYYSKRIADSIQQNDPNAQIVLMGDLNDDPNDRSVKRFVTSKNTEVGFYNPMETLHRKGVGSIAHRDRWHLFDQLIFTNNFLKEGPLRLQGAGVYRKKFLTQLDGKFKNYPLRTYVGQHYVGGYSDHFPVIAILTPTAPKGYE